jgi:hypothetical protein
MMPDNAWEQLMLLKELTKTTGVLHEAQVLQLKMWPYVAFQKLDKYEIAIDLDKKSVWYKMTSGSLPGDEKTKGAASLKKNVKALLGDDWEVIVSWTESRKYNGRRTRKSKRAN